MASVAIEDSRHSAFHAEKSAELIVDGPYIEPKLSQNLIEKRQALLAKLNLTNYQIPPQFPNHIPSPSGLSAEPLDVVRVTHELHHADIEELEVALSTFQNQHYELNELSRETFPLPTLGPRLRIISADVHNEHGLSIIKGLDPDNYTIRENIIIYAGIASYIGDKRGTQSGQFDVLTHVRAASEEITDPRPGFMKEDLPFHNDYGEILSLYVVEPAASGGNTMISSATCIYEEIARSKPYLISILAKNDWPHWTARKPNKEKYFPLLFPGENNMPFFGFTRYALTGSQSTPRPKDIPPLTLLQAEAIDTVEILAARNAIALPHRKGDIQFISNRAFLHARTAYQDPSDDRARHLMRLILMDSEFGHPLATAEQERWGSCFDYKRDQGQWILEKNHTPWFASAKQFDSLFLSEHDTHSNN